MTKKEAKAAPRQTVAQRMGEKVAQVRNAMGLTQAEFAKRVGMGKKWQKLSAYETGRARVPLEWLERISAASGYPITYFLEVPEGAELTDDEQKLLAVYRATRDPRIKEMTLDAALSGLKADERFRGEDEEDSEAP